MEDARPPQAQSRRVGREDIVAVWLGSSLDPRDKIVEGLLAYLAIERAMAWPPHRALHEQMGRAGGERPASIALLKTPRHASVSGLVEGEHGHGYAAGELGEGGVHAA